MKFIQTLIFLPLLLSVGVVLSRYTLSDEDGEVLRPFITNSQKRRICVELCLSGLGGISCGTDCADIIPQDLPIQSFQDNTTTKAVRNVTRNDSCTFLCKNNLGSPLCICDDVSNSNDKKKSEPDFLAICSQFCVKYSYRIAGCQKCSIYKDAYSTGFDSFSQQSLMSNYGNVDWYAWCQNKCGKGDGGAACNCDRLPLY